MKRQFASQDPTLLEIAKVLGIQPDTVLQWIIEGRVLVAMQGPRTKIMVDSDQTYQDQTPGKVMILIKQPPTQKWRTFSY
jgi:hypothetical protein